MTERQGRGGASKWANAVVIGGRIGKKPIPLSEDGFLAQSRIFCDQPTGGPLTWDVRCQCSMAIS